MENKSKYNILSKLILNEFSAMDKKYGIMKKKNDNTPDLILAIATHKKATREWTHSESVGFMDRCFKKIYGE